MPYQGDSPDSLAYRSGIGAAGYQEPYPGGKPPSLSQISPQPSSAGAEHMRPLKLTPEELALARKISNQQLFTRALPFALGCTVGFRFLHLRGIITVKYIRPWSIGVFSVSYFISRLHTNQDVIKQVTEKYPNGVLAQSKKMNIHERMEYARQLSMEAAKTKVESAGMQVEEKTTERSLDPESRNQVPGLDDRYRPTVDSFDFNKSQGTKQQPEYIANKKTSYAELRQQAHRDMTQSKYGDFSSQRQSDSPFNQDNKPSVDDPPSKLRTIKKNKYGDEME